MSYAASAYARTSQSVLTPREAEAAVLMKAARQLQAVQDDWTNQSTSLAQALNFNQRIWAILASEATEASNPLPQDVKQNIGKLAVFVFRRMLDTMVEPAPGKLSALISINQNLAAGLSGR